MHPDSLCAAVVGIDVSPSRRAGGKLGLRYVVNGVIGDVLMPETEPPKRADELWQHTCLELFLRDPAGEGYVEFNFSPSTEWAAYGFAAYREGMRPLDLMAAPKIELRTSRERFEMDVALDLTGIDLLPTDQALRAGFSAIIEGTGHHKSWWALAHPQGKPDFHHSETFALDLPPSEQT
jgi:hypothetical protein